MTAGSNVLQGVSRCLQTPTIHRLLVDCFPSARALPATEPGNRDPIRRVCVVLTEEVPVLVIRQNA